MLGRARIISRHAHQLSVLGDASRVVVMRDGRAFGFGYGRDACLGLSLTRDQYTPIEYPELRITVQQIE